tara:strand:- start:29767 stop:31263 length:1497 start_codon:yes stop_codon:yes gene_type:complete
LESPFNLIQKNNLVTVILSIIFGGISVFSYAPFGMKWVLVISISYLFLLIKKLNNKKLFWNIFFWGLAYWIIGTGWLIVSIYYHGNTSIYIAIIIMIIMSSILSLVFIAPIFLTKFYVKEKPRLYIILFLSSSMALLEISRFYLLGGFPWLLPGIIFMDTYLKFLIPIIGVIGSSLIIYLVCSYIAFARNRKYSLLALAAFVLVLLIPNKTYITNSKNTSIEVGIVQPNFEPLTKFNLDTKANITDHLIKLSNEVNSADLIIWPEAPFGFTDKHPKFKEIEGNLKEDGARVVSGLFHEDEGKIYSSLKILGSDLKPYKKVNLVPFGEYVPFESILRGLIRFFDLPMSDMSWGEVEQDNIRFGENTFVPLICFDIAFINNYLHKIKGSGFIVNISNDSWFGNSYGPDQHVEIIRARAIETNRWIARSTSDGISTIVDNNGTIVYLLNKNTSGVIKGDLEIVRSLNFFTKYGYQSIIALILFMFIFSLVKLIYQKKQDEN